jgi:PAS domain S-box-containing protein
MNDMAKEVISALRESEYQLRQIIETVPAFLWSTGPDGEPTHISQRILDYSGMRLEDFQRGGWEALMHPADFPETAKAFYHAIQTGTSYEGIHRLRRAADDEYRWYHARGEPLRDREGRIVQWYGLSIDIDERKRAEQALRESEAKLRRSEAWLAQAQRLSHTGNWVHDATTTRYLYWSDESYRIWGLDPLQGLPSRKNMWQRIHPDDRERVREEVQEALRQQRDFTAEFRILLPDGTVRYLEATTHHEFSSLGALVEAVSTHVDVTERKRAQEEHERLRQLESDLAHMHRLSMMGELAASLAHEIAQPIAAARNNARAALHFSDRSSIDLGQVREALTCVVDDTDRAGQILERIRDHIKKAPPRKERVDLNQAITDVIALAQGAIIKNGVSVITRLTEGLPHVQADRVQVQQVVLNLVLNAVEAMSLVKKGERELTISADRYEVGGILVTVRDSGPGIDSKHLDRVFDAFYTTKSSGVGMGLSICRSIINAHGGWLWADVNASRGAVFRFTLPGADMELTNSFRPAQLPREPHEDTASDAAHQPAYEGNKRPRRSGRGRVPRRRDKR